MAKKSPKRTGSPAEAKPARQGGKEFLTSSGIPLKPLYTPQDVSCEKNSLPGEYPFTRGAHPTMYRGKLWTMRQYSGFGAAKETNRRSKYLIERGQTGLSIAFDLPTQVGYDSDDPRARGEVGRVGVSVQSLEDMEELFDGIPLDKVSVSMTINATAHILLAFYLASAKKQGIDFKNLRGTIQNDILKEYIARGTYIYPPEASLKITGDLFAYCTRELPRWNSISVSGYHIREAGANAVQEVAFTLANAVAYVESALREGLAIDDFAPRVSFFFNAHNDFLEEIAKFRAARRLWAKIVKERFGAKNPRSMMLRFHVQTAGSTLTAQEADNNIVRVGTQALAAILGGAQSVHTNSRDEALALPTEASVLTALRTQQILAYETGAANTVDPVAGSYCIERLTDEIEEKAKEYIAKIDEMGGSVPAIRAGFFRREIEESAYRCQREIEEGKKLVVGVNIFKPQTEEIYSTLKVSRKTETEQVKRLKALKKNRDGARVKKALADIKASAKSGENLLPPTIRAAECSATIGEIAGVLREVFGEYKEADA